MPLYKTLCFIVWAFHLFVFPLSAAGEGREAAPSFRERSCGGRNRPAGLRFASERLSDMAGRLHLVVPESVAGEGSCRLTTDFRRWPVVVELDRGTVVHIGVDVFGPQYKAEAGSVWCDFAERWLLERLLSGSSEEAGWEEEVETKGDWTRLADFKASSGTFRRTLSGGRRWTMSWTEGEELLFSMTFPCDYELISGKNIIELENGFPEEVRRWASFHDGPDGSAPAEASGEGRPACADTARRAAQSVTAVPAGIPVRKAGRFVRSGDIAPVRLTEDLWFLDEGTFLTDRIKARTWWTKAPGGFRLVCDKAFPAESLCNLLSSPAVGGGYVLDYTLKKYGFVSERHTCLLRDMVGWCLASGCTPYVGVSSTQGGRLEAVLVMANAGLGYNHLFKVCFDKSILESDSGTLRAEIHVYVPVNNVMEVYHEGE